MREYHWPDTWVREAMMKRGMSTACTGTIIPARMRVRRAVRPGKVSLAKA